MATRSARRRLGAASALGLLVTWATIAITGAARAQQFAERGNFNFADDDSFGPQAEFQQGEVPEDWGAEYGACGCDGCGDACGGSHMSDSDCLWSSRGTGTPWWFGAELLLWRIDGTHLPPLVTDSPVGTTPTLDLPTTDVIAGNNVAGNSWRTGYRLELGVWFDDCHELALVGDYFDVGEDDYDYFFPGGSGRNTGRPYFDTEDGVQAAWIIAAPGLFEGTVAITADDDFQGLGLAIMQRVYSVGDSSGYGPGTQVSVLGGYRFFSYDSQLSIRDSRTDLDGTDEGDQFFRRDLFNTDNEFQGGEIGVIARLTQTGCWFDGVAKLAIGGHRKRATVSGDTAIIPDGMPVEFEEGGLLTSETNIGTYSDSRVRFIPTFRLGAGAFLTPQWTVQAGYSVIIWGGVARAAGLTPPNLAVDPRNVPPVEPGGGPAPVFPGIGGSELVAHGLDLGIQYCY